MDVAPEGEMKGMDGGVVHPYGKGWEGFLEEVRLQQLSGMSRHSESSEQEGHELTLVWPAYAGLKREPQMGADG